MKYLDKKGVTQYVFSQRTGLSNGFLKSGSSLSVDNLRLISSIFNDLNVLWVIYGEGPMIVSSIGHTQIGSDNRIVHSSVHVQADGSAEIDRMKQEIDMLKSAIKDKDEIIQLLKRK